MISDLQLFQTYLNNAWNITDKIKPNPAYGIAT